MDSLDVDADAWSNYVTLYHCRNRAYCDKDIMSMHTLSLVDKKAIREETESTGERETDF